jgi:hypothetical protein
MLGNKLHTFPLSLADSYLPRSSVVEQVLVGAWDDGKRFSVVVVDSRPMLEGKRPVIIVSFAISSCGLRNIRQEASLRTFCHGYPLHIPPSAIHWICHHRGVDSLSGRSLPTFERRRIFPCRHGSCSYDGKTTQCSCRRLLRDIQVRGNNPAR